MRKLATIRQISAIADISGADKIEAAFIDGWSVVVNKGEFAPGDAVVFVEIDSWVPHALAPFLSKGKAPREYQGIPGERLRTVKLRGQLSQGLVLPLEAIANAYLPPVMHTSEHLAKATGNIPWGHGHDVSELLGIVKWEREIPAQMRGQARGNFPSFIPKTDQERVQNLVREIEAIRAAGDESFEVTIKLDGTSFTGYHKDGATGFCSRNLELQPEDESSVYGQIFKKYRLAEVLAATEINVAIQGEIMGPGIQGNREGLTEPTLFIFDVFNIDEQRYLDPAERGQFFEQFLRPHGLQHAPLLCFMASLPSVRELLQFAEGKSLNHPVREGLVYKSCDRDFSFNAISNQFLMAGGD